MDFSMDCHANFQSARNDKKEVDCHDSATAESRNDNAFSPSLRGSEATEAKQGEAAASLAIHKSKVDSSGSS